MTEQTPQSTALVTIDPPSYVAAVYEPFHKRLSDAIAQAKDVTYDIGTKAGMETAKGMRAMFREIRISCEKKRAECKAPILEIGKLLDSRNKEIEQQVEPFESRFDADIKAEEKRLDDEKVAKIKAETERQNRLQGKIDDIKSKPLAAINLNADGTQALIDELLTIIADEANFEERFVEAEVALQSAIEQLKQMVSGKRAQEQIAAQQEAQRKEQERVDSIQRRIQFIKNYIIKGTECATSKAVQDLITEFELLDFVPASFDEFSDEATAAVTRTKAVLNSQLTAAISAEQAESERITAEKLERDQQSTPAAEIATVANVEDISTASAPAPAQIAETRRAAVVDHQDDIATFIALRSFKDENRIRAILVEFVAHQATRAMKIAA